jgi:TetR/AcrR family transcriptional regulator, transcriptional repressor for nem operon
MARPKQFDPQVALERAMEVFWRQGFEATTVQDLVAGMGINRASIYSTFGDKHQLFVAALDHYAQSAGRELIDLLEGAGPADEVLRRAMAQVVDWQAGDETPLGCFVTNSAMELCARCPETSDKVNASLARLEEAFRALVERGQASGQISDAKSPDDLARFLCVVTQGLVVLGKARVERGALEQAVEVALTALRATP